jgi:hypothetical protein
MNNEQITMSKQTLTGWIVATASIALAIGVAIGGGYAMHQADGVIDALHAADKASYDTLKNNFDDVMVLNGKLQDALRLSTAVGTKLLGRVGQDDAALKGFIDDAEESAGESTVIYERSPQLQIRFTGIRGLPILPLPGNGQQLPRVLIPGKVRPLILAPDGDARQAVFYYVDKKNHLHGPYAPEVVKPQ